MDGLDASDGGASDANYKFSQSFEMGGLGEKVIEELNANWTCKKVPIPLDADRKLAKNQTRIEFWSFTESKLGDITLKESGRLSPGSLKAELKTLRAKNVTLCAKEIKRIEAAQKAREKAEKEALSKGTAAK